mmetsp:Transcript_88002/g.221463  ORF Transcript_88002/g.221463 Transcript_88002/m.221463 type:complete len:440 (-) Transcript_88002:84-1403(-)
MPNLLSSGKVSLPFTCGTATLLAKPEPLDHISELAKFDVILEALGACGRSLAGAASELETAPPKLLAEISKAFPDGEALPVLASSFATCGTRLQQSKQHMAAVQDLLGAARKQGAEVRKAIAARDAAWAPKLAKDKDADILNRRFSKAVSLQEKRTLLQAKHQANEDFRRSDEEARTVLGSLLAQRWQVTAAILAEICRSHAIIFAGSQHLSSDFNRLVEQLLVPGVARERGVEEQEGISAQHFESVIRDQSSRSHSEGPIDRIAGDGSTQCSADDGTNALARDVSRCSFGSQGVDEIAQEVDSSGQHVSAANPDTASSSALAPASIRLYQSAASLPLSSLPAAPEILAEASFGRGEQPPTSSAPVLWQGSGSRSSSGIREFGFALGRSKSAEASVQPSWERQATLSRTGTVARACSLGEAFGSAAGSQLRQLAVAGGA